MTRLTFGANQLSGRDLTRVVVPWGGTILDIVIYRFTYRRE